MSRWFATGHETVGNLYLSLSAVLLFVAGIAALLARAELFEPGLAFLAPAEFHRAVTAHGMFAVFGVAFPACAGLASRLVPGMTGVREMAFPRTHAVSFWLLLPAFVLVGAALFGSPADPVGGDVGVGRWPAVPADAPVMFASGVPSRGCSVGGLSRRPYGGGAPRTPRWRGCRCSRGRSRSPRRPG